jgi:hypothetical protein
VEIWPLDNLQVIEAFPCFVLVDEKHRNDRSKTTAGDASP